MKNSTQLILVIIVSCVVCLSVGYLGSKSTTSENMSGWYASLNKPSFNPPGWIFGPVWTILYIMMGISFALVFNKGIGQKAVLIAVICFVVQLILNGIWSPVFFGLQKPFEAFLIIIALWLAIIVTIWKFYGVSKPAAALLIPYLIWVSFASILNASIWILNK